MVLWRILFGIDVLAAVVVFFFFAWGVSDGSVSSFNIGTWMAILAVVAAVLGGGAALRANGHPVLSGLVLLILAGPASLYGLFVLVLIIAQPNWH